MGAWLTMESLRQMAIRDGRLPGKVQNVILASPDLDVDVFRAQFRSFGEKRPSIVVFLSRRDRALQLSRGIGGNVERLGAIDPSEQPWIGEKGVEVVDLSDTAGADPLRHSKFAQNPDVVRFLGEELITGASRAPPTGFGERMGELSTGVVQGVGGVAGIAVNAPIAIVDPDFRRAYADRLQQFREAVNSAVASGPDR
jgi:esterase/lipase superfamily enzyme